MSAETVDDLQAWLRNLSGCPTVNHTVAAVCANPSHDEPATWFYVEADRVAGVARMRCLSCGLVRTLLDSDERWTFPPTWACLECAQSIAEVAFGLHLEDDDSVSWAAVGVRCVNCGDLSGVADFVVERATVEGVTAAL